MGKTSRHSVYQANVRKARYFTSSFGSFLRRSTEKYVPRFPSSRVISPWAGDSLWAGGGLFFRKQPTSRPPLYEIEVPEPDAKELERLSAKKCIRLEYWPGAEHMLLNAWACFSPWSGQANQLLFLPPRGERDYSRFEREEAKVAARTRRKFATHDSWRWSMTETRGPYPLPREVRDRQLDLAKRLLEDVATWQLGESTAESFALDKRNSERVVDGDRGLESLLQSLDISWSTEHESFHFFWSLCLCVLAQHNEHVSAKMWNVFGRWAVVARWLNVAQGRGDSYRGFLSYVDDLDLEAEERAVVGIRIENLKQSQPDSGLETSIVNPGSSIYTDRQPGETHTEPTMEQRVGVAVAVTLVSVSVLLLLRALRNTRSEVTNREEMMKRLLMFTVIVWLLAQYVL